MITSIGKRCEKAAGSKQNQNSEASTYTRPVSDINSDDETSLAQLAFEARGALDTDDLLI